MILDSHINLAELSSFLQLHKVIPLNDYIRKISIPGQGNMNVVFRVETVHQTSFIIKQSRPFVQRYQSIPAPIERIAVEHAFYQATHEIKAFLPQVLTFIPDHNLLVLEDLGNGDDLTHLYHQKEFRPQQLEQLVKVARGIHQSSPTEAYPDNKGLLQLNHQHIFTLPFQRDNQFDLDSIQEGLSALSSPFQQDMKLRTEVYKLGQHYLSAGDTLVHGDYYPGSWLERQGRIFVLDPEFSHLGCAEFDLGTLCAHSLLITHESDCLPRITSLYDRTIDEALIRKYAGVEVIRRLIGLAQLPIERTIQEKKDLLETARSWVMD